MKAYLWRSAIQEKPPYQRESSVWSLEKQQLFIDSLLNGYDVPKIYLHDLRGIEEQYELPTEADANLFEMDDDLVEKLGIQQLPQSLSDALHTMENSTLVADALGEHIFEWFLRNKRDEWRRYKTHISQYELDRYLKQL